jgi:hypothetical protein
MSTAKDRLYEVYSAYRRAVERRPTDLKQAGSVSEVNKILGNLNKLHAQYFKAALAELDATGADVESAYRAAKSANEAVAAAYDQAKALAERIRLVSKLLDSVTDLVKKAAS